MDESGRQLARGEIKIWTDGGREGGREGEARRKGAEDRFSFSFPPLLFRSVFFVPFALLPRYAILEEKEKRV